MISSAVTWRYMETTQWIWSKILVNSTRSSFTRRLNKIQTDLVVLWLAHGGYRIWLFYPLWSMWSSPVRSTGSVHWWQYSLLQWWAVQILHKICWWEWHTFNSSKEHCLIWLVMHLSCDKQHYLIDCWDNVFSSISEQCLVSWIERHLWLAFGVLINLPFQVLYVHWPPDSSFWYKLHAHQATMHWSRVGLYNYGISSIRKIWVCPI